VAALRQAVETEPLAATGWWVLSYVYAGMGQLDEARAAAARSMEVAPEDPHGARNLGLALLLEGRFEEAAAAFERSSSPAFRSLGAALVQHGLGHAKEARLALDALMAQGDFAAAYQIAQVYAWRGEKDQAFAWLERAYAQRDSGLADYVKWDPLLRGLRDDPRYVALLRKMRLGD
jgi:serine/threonine-protein kinase